MWSGCSSSTRALSLSTCARSMASWGLARAAPPRASLSSTAWFKIALLRLDDLPQRRPSPHLAAPPCIQPECHELLGASRSSRHSFFPSSHTPSDAVLPPYSAASWHRPTPFLALPRSFGLALVRCSSCRSGAPVTIG